MVGSSYALPLTAEDAGELLEEQLQFEREFSKITTNDNDVKMKLETGDYCYEFYLMLDGFDFFLIRHSFHIIIKVFILMSSIFLFVNNT